MGTQPQFFVAAPPRCFSAAGERLLRASAVARRIHRTQRMVRYLAEAGLLPGFKCGKLWLFREADVLAFVMARDGAYVH
jgi:helix-turn-helix protein